MLAVGHGRRRANWSVSPGGGSGVRNFKAPFEAIEREQAKRGDL
jgi:4-hydroxyphenylpyruvate dioxygenase-like putative hemolysin